MMREKIGAPGEIQSRVLDACEDVVTRAANVQDAAAVNWALLAAAEGKMLVVTELLQLEHQRVAHGRAARYGAVAGPARDHPTGRARVDELLWHTGRGGSRGRLRHQGFTALQQGWTNLRKNPEQ